MMGRRKIASARFLFWGDWSIKTKGIWNSIKTGAATGDYV